jgi:hypothetical protein
LWRSVDDAAIGLESAGAVRVRRSGLIRKLMTGGRTTAPESLGAVRVGSSVVVGVTQLLGRSHAFLACLTAALRGVVFTLDNRGFGAGT